MNNANGVTLDPNLSLIEIIQQQLGQIETVALVRVVAVSPADDHSGTVDVQPLVQQLWQNGEVRDHGIIQQIPYYRIQGGKNAVIIDPEVGDIGLCAFCSRDNAGVIKTRQPSPPLSYRRYDLSDGIYFGGLLNGEPENLVRVSGKGIEITSTTKITISGQSEIDLNAPVVNLNGNLSLNGSLTQKPGSYGSGASFNSPITTSSTITAAGDVCSGGVSLTGHTHTGVKSGNSSTGGPS